jgi:hypothetical protein
MAVVITRAVTETYDPNIWDSSGLAVLGAAQNNNLSALRRLMNMPTFTFEATTTAVGDAPAVIANSGATLGALGVVFPLGTIRNVRVRVSSRTLVTNGGYSEKVFTFRGAATLGTVTQVADGNLMTTAPTAYALPFLYLQDGTNVGVPAMGIDATAGPFVTVWSAVPGALQTGVAINARHAVEIFVEPLIVLPAF